MFGCFSLHKKSYSETALPTELQIQFTIRQKKYSSKSLLKEEENQKLEIKLHQENLDIYKQNLNLLANKKTKDKEGLSQNAIIKKTLINENSLLNNYCIHIRSLITGLRNKLYDYETKLDEKITEETDKSLADDHIFFLKNLFMSKESKIMQYNTVIDNLRNKKNKQCNFELEIKEKDEYYFNEVLKNERERLNVSSKHLNNEAVKNEKLTSDIKNIKSLIEKLQNPAKLTDTEVKNNENSSKSSVLPTTLSSALNPTSIILENDKLKQDKLEEIEKLKIKIKRNEGKTDQINKELLILKKEFTGIQEELYRKNEELSNKFSDIYNLELKLDKIRIKKGKGQCEQKNNCENNI